GLVGWCNYRTELFDEPTITRLLQHWRVLLQAAVEDPAQPLTELPLLTEAEREQVLVQWNETNAEYPRETCIHELFEQQVQQTPSATAVHFDGAQLSYRKLNARANQLAHYLRERGVRAGEPVGLCVERSLEMVIGILGVLKAGGGYVPIDPDYPRERVAQMLSDSRLNLLLTQQHLAEQLPKHDAQVVRLDSDWQEIAQHPLTNPPTVTTTENLAYMIYTSGSTGQPKGVTNTHRGICNRLFWMQDAYRLTPDDRVLQKTPFSFDVSVWEFFWPLLTGARLVMAEPGGHQNPTYLRQIIEQEQITVLHFVPAMLQVFLDEPDLQRCTSLRLVICSGEALSFDLQQKFFAHCGAALHNLYGPTEAAVDVTYWACDPDSNRKVVPIGKPIANTQIYLLDQNYEPVPIGVVGELHIGGVNLARGYHEKPGLTAEKFVPDPFSREPGARLYKTGDLSRYLPDGAIEFLGRIDHQVKLRGFRIELGEIETVLRQHASVNEALVVMQNIRDREQRLVAYVQLQAGAQGTASELRTYLKERLPEYMVPPVIVELEQWPLMPNGKVNRKALPAPEQTGEAIAEYVAPRTPEEELLAGIWAEVLEVERLSVHDDFFARGGHSLLATQVIARMREVFHVDVPLRSMFENPSVAQLSAALKKGLFNHARDIHPIARASRNDALPLSFAQERLWFWEQLQPGTPTYNLTSAFRIDGDLDVSILEQSLNEIIRRHEILRTSYAAVEGQPVQIVAPHSFVPLTVTDLSDLPASERDFEVRRLAGEQALRPFDLTKAPLLRVSLLRLNAQEHVAVVSMHHIVSDAWSLGVLVEEIAVLYQEFLNGNTSPLPELPVQYADFAKWQREWVKGDVLTEQLAYWKEQLRDAPLLQLRTDRPRPQVYSSKGSIVPLNIPSELLRELKALSRKNNVTLFMTLLAAFNVLLHRHTGQDDIVVGTDIANRTRVETEKLIGFFVNMLVLRTSLKDDPTFT
ncbi:MAG TPA: amino acid adenylation domain-containing protein, partial [Pyrinomonadaceae bacterium]